MNRQPCFKSFQASIWESYPQLASAIGRMQDEFGPDWERDFDNFIRFFFDSQGSLDKAIRGYAAFALEAMKLQHRFQKTRRYQSSTFRQASELVYNDRDYMESLYLPGILLSHFLWRHHFLQQGFFDRFFLPEIPNEARVFCDIGVGTGFYSNRLLEKTSLEGVGVDLNPVSLDWAKGLVSKSGFASRYSAVVADIGSEDFSQMFEVIVSVEVLEHLEDPLAFLQALHLSLKPGGIGFIAAAVNGENADHIYLYESEKAVEQHVVAAGFEVLHSSADAAYTPRFTGEIVPVNAAFVVKSKSI